MITIDFDVTQITVFLVGVSFAIGLYVARDEYYRRKNENDHKKLENCIHKIMNHFGLKDGLEDLKQTKGNKNQ